MQKCWIMFWKRTGIVRLVESTKAVDLNVDCYDQLIHRKKKFPVQATNKKDDTYKRFQRHGHQQHEYKIMSCINKSTVMRSLDAIA